MKKICVIGSPGSGKSVLSRAISKKLNIPLFCMDKLFWRENWTHVSLEELKDSINEILKLDSYIIDGNFKNTLEMRFIDADTIIYLNIDVDTCIKSVNERIGKKREDLPEYLVETYDPEFIQYIKDFDNESGTIIRELIAKYPNKNYITFNNRDDVNKYIETL